MVLPAGGDAAVGRYRWATRGLLLLTAAATGLAVVVAAARTEGPASGNFGGLPEVVAWDVNMLAAAAIGALVAQTRPRNSIGWYLSLGGAIGAVASAGDQWALYVLHDRGGGRGVASAGAALSVAGLYASWALIGAHAPLRFPDGRIESRGGRVLSFVVSASAAGCAAWLFSSDLLSGPTYKAAGVESVLAIPGADPVLDVLFVGIFGLFGVMFLAVALLFVRMVRARGMERQQLKVVAYGVGATAGLAVAEANLAPHLRDTWGEHVLLVVGPLVYALPIVAFGVAVLRHRLYDVDRVVSRAIAYTALLALVAALYVAVVTGVGSVLGRGADGEPNLALLALATAVVAISFHPARLRLESLANRLVYGRRASPYEVVAGFARRMAAALSLEDVLPRLAEAAATGTGAVAGRVEVFVEGAPAEVASWPPDAAGRPVHHSVPIAHGDEEVGRLGVVLGEGLLLGPTQARLLQDLAAQAGVAVRTAQLAAELQARLEEISRQSVQLRRSRQRIVAAADEERRRVERDLHDGAQQRLVSLAMVLRMARTRAPASLNAELHTLLDEAAGELEQAQRELRDLARGIYPAVLIDGGLAPAVGSLAERSSVPVEVAVAEQRFPPAVELTAYFVVSEALANVAKHAGADGVRVRIEPVDRRVHVEVVDDGVGGAAPGGGSGLRGLADRVAALGGTFEVDSPVGNGTRVVAVLPCE